MELTATVNANKRYYPDEGTISNYGSFIDTLCRFNDIKIDLYNCLYDQRFLGSAPFGDGTYDSFLKNKYKISSYYTCSIYTAAAGMISSQKELRYMYKTQAEEDIKTRKDKIKDVSGTLNQKQHIKDSIRVYVKTGKWNKPYPKCVLKVSGGKAAIYNKEIPLEQYERKVEEDIRSLKNRLKMLKSGLSRKEAKLKNLEEQPPKRILFGTKKFYKEKDKAEAGGMAAWKEKFAIRRHRSMSLPGRHTSADCNFLVYLRGNDLHVKCMDGNVAVFHGFRLSRYWEEYQALLSLGPKERQAVCYNFKREVDRDGREYIIPSATMKLENKYANFGFSDGCISIDQNWDNITLSDISADGTCLDHRTIPFQLEGKTSGQVSCIIGNVMKQVGDYCEITGKCLVIEDIDTTKKRGGMRYGSRKGNRHASMFAYQKITACAYSQGFQKGFEVYKVDPSYTSQAAKILYMRGMGCPIHEAASYTIGLKAMGLNHRLAPPKLMTDLLPQKLLESGNIWAQWKHITKKLKGVRTHLFYGAPPDKELAALKKPTLASYAKALKDRDGCRFKEGCIC